MINFRLNFVLQLCIGSLLCMVVGGCTASPNNNLNWVSAASRTSAAMPYYGPARLTPPEIRSEVMSFADNYLTQVSQAMDEMAFTTSRREVSEWALQMKISTALAAYTNAGGPNEVVSLLDMLVLVTLKREALEEYWIPTFLHDEGAGVRQAYRNCEKQAWELGARVLTQQQIDELRALIEQWRKDNPGQYYIGYIRFAEFAAYRRIDADSPQVKKAGSLFGLLYIDPLANLDPVAQELRNYRALTERIMFIAERSPIVLGWQAEYAMTKATSTPQMLEFIAASQKFADASDHFAKTSAGLPEEFAREREALVKQIAGEMTRQRQELLEDIDQREKTLRQILDDVQQLIDHMDRAGASVNQQTQATIGMTDQLSSRLVNQIFWRAIILIVAIVLAVPAAALGYRLVTNRR
jgi:hypothetical protein